MNSGTKIVLSLVTLFVGILVVYYGFVMPTGEGPRDSTLPLSVATDPVQSELSGPIEPAKPVKPVSPPVVVMGEPTSLGAPDRSARPAAKAPALVREQVAGPTRPAGDRRPLAAATTSRIDNKPRPPAAKGPTERPERESSPRPIVPPPAPPAPKPRFTPYTVVSGDSMSSIALDWFGDDRRWHLIAKANPLVDPSQLRIGQVLRLPPRTETREPVPSTGRNSEVIYRVRSGDTLSRIAAEHYGKADSWKQIYAANRAKIGRDPGALEVGMELLLPPAP